MNPETITNKIHAQSDESLKARLRPIFESAMREFTDGCTKPIEVQGGWIEGQNNTSRKFIVDGHDAIKVLEKLAFEMQRDRCRTDAVNDFLNKVESLQTQIEEIQQTL